DALAALQVARIGDPRVRAPGEQDLFGGTRSGSWRALESIAQLLDLHRQPLRAQIGWGFDAEQQFEFDQRLAPRFGFLFYPLDVVVARILIGHGMQRSVTPRKHV